MSLLILLVFTACTDTASLLRVESSPGGDTDESGTTLAKASSDIQREVIPLDIVVPSACLSEMVHVEGPVEVQIKTTVDGQGNMHQMGKYHWKEVTATGVDSRNTWHTTAGLELYMVRNYALTEPFQPVPTPELLGEPAVFHHTGAIRFKSDDGQPDLYVHHVVQIRVDSNGDVHVLKDDFELLACR